MKNNFIHNKKWFSLTELILVVSIIAIISSLGIIAYSQHAATARDASRIKQSEEISSGLELYSLNKKLPTPEDAVDILLNGVLIWYQWYATQNILELIDFYDGGTDPIDRKYNNRKEKNPFTYYMTKDGSHAQMLVFLESNDSVSFFPQTYALDYTWRIPRVAWSNLGVLTDQEFNSPVQEISTLLGVGSLDIWTTNEFYVAHISNQEKIQGDSSSLPAAYPYSSCRRLDDIWKGNGNKVYRVDPSWAWYINVYCDMETAEGGWTLIWSKSSGGDQTKWNFGEVEVTLWSNTNVNIIDDTILDGLSEAMACSSENCWKWELSDTFKGCLRDGCPSSVIDINNLVRVRGTTGFSLWETDRIWYNNTSQDSYMFAAFPAGWTYDSPSVGSWNLRVNMDGDWISAWSEWDEWNLYVR